MLIDAVETPQCSFATSNAVSPFDKTPTFNMKKRIIPHKKRIGTRRRKATSFKLVNWLWDYAQLCRERSGPKGKVAFRGGLSKGSKPVFPRVSEKTTENS